MRVGIGVVAVAFVLAFGAQAHAQTFPDLPGMGAVAKTTNQKAPSTSRSVSAPSTSTTSNKTATPSVSGAAKSTVKPQDVSSILQMPGSRSLPIIRDYRTAMRTKTAIPDVLFVLAGIGTATSLGMLWAVRRRFGA